MTPCNNFLLVPSAVSNAGVSGSPMAYSALLSWTGGAGDLSAFRVSYTTPRATPPSRVFEYGQIRSDTLELNNLMADTSYTVNIYAIATSPEGYAESAPTSITFRTGKGY